MVLKGLKEKLKLRKTPRATDAWDRLRHDAGLIPVVQMTDVESRRAEVKEALGGEDSQLIDVLFPVVKPDKPIKDMTEEGKKQFVQKVIVRNIARKLFIMYFWTGNPYYRGLDNRELADKVVCFLANYSEVGYMDEFTPDLMEEALQLQSLSWQEKDVTPTPITIVESRPVVMAGASKGSPTGEIDQASMSMMRQEIEELRKIQEAQKQ